MPVASTSASSSPQPLAVVSTPPSSTSKDANKMENPTQSESEAAHAAQLTSDVEVLEERNTSPAPQPNNNNNNKRKSTDAESTTEPKKAKLAAASSAPTKATSTAAASKGKGKGKGDDAPLVELKKAKFVFKQKPLDLNSTISAMTVSLKFSTFISDLFSNDDAKLDDWPQEHWPVVARLIHESDKTPQALLKYVKDQLVKMTESALGGAGEDDSQDSQMQPKLSLADRFPTAPLKALIESLATRTNYGLDASDLPSGLPTGISEIPAGLQIWRWELHDPSLLPSELDKKLTQLRADRVTAKSQAVSLVLALSDSDRQDLFVKKASGAAATAAAKKDKDDEPVASGSGSGDVKGKGKAVKKDKDDVDVKPKKTKAVKPEVDEEEAKEKAKLKAKKDAEKEERKAAKAQADAEREEKKAKKLAVENEKKAKEDKKKAEISKQSGFFNGFFTKKSASPAPASLTYAVAAGTATPGGSKETDFTRTFKPFHIRPSVTVAPVNGFRKSRPGKTAPKVQINSLESITLEESLASFLEGVPKHRIPPYNPHPTPFLAVRDAVHKINDASATGSDVSAYYQMLESRAKVPIKLLKFKEDVRPGYVGTWTKTSRVVGPRTPFGRDTALLRYDYDSEDEWEEDDTPDADDVNSGCDMSEDGSDSDALSDDWLCDDDEVEFQPGHEGDDSAPIPMDVDGDGELFIMESATDVARRKVAEREKKSKSAKDGARKRKLAGPLLPLVKGPYWEQTIGETVYPQFESLKIQFLNDASFGLDPLSFVSKAFISSSTSSAKSTSASGPKNAAAPTADQPPSFVPGVTGGAASKVKAAAKVKPAKPLATNVVPLVLDLVHGSKLSRQGVADNCHASLSKDQKVTKAAVLLLMQELGIEKIKVDGQTEKTWVVTPEMRARYPSSAIVID
ncbi:hypothetical protein RQP46_000779 [Phenoliferia psychrophenolica]